MHEASATIHAEEHKERQEDVDPKIKLFTTPIKDEWEMEIKIWHPEGPGTGHIHRRLARKNGQTKDKTRQLEILLFRFQKRRGVEMVETSPFLLMQMHIEKKQHGFILKEDNLTECIVQE